MNQKQRQEYLKFEQENYVPFQLKLGILETACYEGTLDLISVYENDVVVGLLPYYWKQKLAYKYICHPPKLKWMGPMVAEKIADKNRVVQKLLVQLPNMAYFEQNFFYNINASHLPEDWQEYFNDQYSYRIEGIQNLEEVYKNIYPDYRNNKLKKAEQVLHISFEGTIDDFISVHHQSYNRQGLAFPLSDEQFKKHVNNILDRKIGILMFAKDQQQNIHSVALLVWDEKTAYYHLAGDDVQLRKSGSGIFICWEAIKYASNVLGLDSFDFEGSMLENVERVRKRFGGIKTHYGKVIRYNSNSFRILQRLKNI